MSHFSRRTLCLHAAASPFLFALAFSAAAQATATRPIAPAYPPAAPSKTATASQAVAPAPIQREKLPDLTFASVSVNNAAHAVGNTTETLVVDHVFPPPAPSGAHSPANPCNRSFTFPVQLVIRNIGSASFVPKGSQQAVGVNIGPWNAAKDLITLNVNSTQTMTWSVTLPPGNYTLDALIDLHNGVAEANPANDKLSWPLQVKCEVRSNITTAPRPIPKP